MSRIAIGILLMSVTASATAQTHQSAAPEVIVRTYALPISIAEFADAMRLVGQIFGEEGVAMSWLECSSGGSVQSPAACNQPLRAGEVILKVTAAHDANSLSHGASLGYSYVDTSRGTGSVATVYVDRVRALSRAAGTKHIDLLARAIAHEIGHLLLGTTQHPAVGLMRAVWSAAELRRDIASDWTFSGDEAVAIRRALQHCREVTIAVSR